MGGRKKDVEKTAVPDSHRSDPYDADYTPGTGFESSGEELDMETERVSGILGFGRTVSSIYLSNYYS